MARMSIGWPLAMGAFWLILYTAGIAVYGLIRRRRLVGA